MIRENRIERNGRARWARRALVALIASPVAALALVNLTLDSGLLPSMLSREPGALQVRWASAWMRSVSAPSRSNTFDGS